LIKPQIPEFIPAVGEVDAFLKIPRPDESAEAFGLNVLDEPCLNQSDPAILEVKLQPFLKRPAGEMNTVVRSLENADKNPKQISKWVSSIEEAHRNKPSPTVTYSKQMPDIDSLMEAWPSEIEDEISSLELPGPDLDVDLHMYILIICSILGIPVHELTNGRSFTESLHVLFTLYTDFKAN
jgi:intraflagellar transport protein 46